MLLSRHGLEKPAGIRRPSPTERPAVPKVVLDHAAANKNHEHADEGIVLFVNRPIVLSSRSAMRDSRPTEHTVLLMLPPNRKYPKDVHPTCLIPVLYKVIDTIMMNRVEAAKGAKDPNAGQTTP